jgi:hypothetical protein
MGIIKKFSDYRLVSENIKYHIDNSISFTNNIFRTGSESFYILLEEVRNLYEDGVIELVDLDMELYENTDIGRYGIYKGIKVPLDIPSESDEYIIEENKHEYKGGKKVEINKPTRSSGPKKYKVYVKNPDTGNIIKINFGDKKGGLSVKLDDKEASKNFAARHDCKNKKDKTTAGYWSCRLPRYADSLGISGQSNSYW